MKRVLIICLFSAFVSNAQVDINGGPTNVPVEGVIEGDHPDLHHQVLEV